MTLGIAIGAAAAIVLGAASTVGLAATSGAFHAPTRVTTSPSQARCTATARRGGGRHPDGLRTGLREAFRSARVPFKSGEL